MQTVTIFNKNIKNLIFLKKKLNFLDKIQSIYKNERLDIEFCIKGKIYLFFSVDLKKSIKITDLEIRDTCKYRKI